MIARCRLARLHRLRTRLREHATAELVRRAATLVALEEQITAACRAEDAARAEAGIAAMSEASGAGLALAWTYADGLARRATMLAARRAGAAIAADAARGLVRERRRDEEQLARLARGVAARADEVTRRAAAVHLDELALGQHGREP